MNCQEFDQIVDELVSSRLKDAVLRERGLAHSAICPACRVRLANTQAVLGGLRSLASTTETSQAPTQTEAILLVAFRRQQEMAASSAQPKMATPSFSLNWLSRLPKWTYAVAAAGLIAVFGYGVSVWQSAKSAPQQVTLTPSPVYPSGFPLRPIPIEEGPMATKKSEKPEIKQVVTRVRIKPIDDGSYVQATLGELIPIYKEEVATDFLPLTHEGDSQPMDSGQVIRVQVPRTAMASFGLPINIERANEPVKADLLLAEDGSARAIRFIR